MQEGANSLLGFASANTVWWEIVGRANWSDGTGRNARNVVNRGVLEAEY